MLNLSPSGGNVSTPSAPSTRRVQPRPRLPTPSPRRVQKTTVFIHVRGGAEREPSLWATVPSGCWGRRRGGGRRDGAARLLAEDVRRRLARGLLGDGARRAVAAVVLAGVRRRKFHHAGASSIFFLPGVFAAVAFGRASSYVTFMPHVLEILVRAALAFPQTPLPLLVGEGPGRLLHHIAPVLRERPGPREAEGVGEWHGYEPRRRPAVRQLREQHSEEQHSYPRDHRGPPLPSPRCGWLAARRALAAARNGCPSA